MPHSSAPFAKVFDFHDRHQVVAFVDPSKGDPTLVILTSSGGALASTRISFKNPDVPSDSKRAGIAKILELIGDAKAREIAGALDDSINKFLPGAGAVNDLLEVMGVRHPPFARLAQGPNGEQVLLIKDFKDDKPSILAVTANHSATAQFESELNRDRHFKNTDQLQHFLTADMMGELGMDSTQEAERSPAKRRGPGMA